MKRIIFSLVFAGAIFAAHAQEYSFDLPRDNGSTISFSETMEKGGKSTSFFNAACQRVQAMGSVVAFDRDGHQALAELRIADPTYNIVCVLNLVQEKGRVHYSFNHYNVDGVSLDNWLALASKKDADRVKSSVFSQTVVTIAEMKGQHALTSMK